MLEKMVGGNIIIKASSWVYLSKLTPWKLSLAPHIKRTNCKLAQFKQNHIPVSEIPPSTEGHGWLILENLIKPVWSEGPMLPPGLQKQSQNKNQMMMIDDYLFVDEPSHSDLEESDGDQL